MYSQSEVDCIIKYKCALKAKSANRRFDDKIDRYHVFDVLRRFGFRCAYCSQELDHKKWQLDHFYPRAMKGKNKINNLAPTCRWCNTMKNALDGHAFIEKCKNISNLNLITSFNSTQ